MRRILATIAVLVYGLLALGLNVHLHFCGGKLKDVAILTEAKKCCAEEYTGSCGFHNECCEDKQFRIALSDEHQPAVQAQEEVVFSTSVLQPEAPVWSLNQPADQSEFPIRPGPPGHRSKIYLTLCRLTYYG